MSPKTPADYRVRAVECERLAEQASNPDTREIMTYLAMRWLALAEQAEKTPLKPKGRTLSTPT
jgi:hypothetical protein